MRKKTGLTVATVLSPEQKEKFDLAVAKMSVLNGEKKNLALVVRELIFDYITKADAEFANKNFVQK